MYLVTWIRNDARRMSLEDAVSRGRRGSQGRWSAGLVLAAAAMMSPPLAQAQKTPAPQQESAPVAAAASTNPTSAAAGQEALEAQFVKTMTGAKLTGFFTITGREQQLKEETYRIASVKKLEGDLWLMQCQIKYGDKDVTVPLPIPVKWADKTPVMTLDQLTIPGLGTFDARVLINDNKYVGTWAHGEVTGHLFGRIEHDTAESQP